MGEQSAAVRAFLDQVTPAKRRRDAETLFGLMGRVTGEQPQPWATAVGYGNPVSCVAPVLSALHPKRQVVCGQDG